MRRLAELRGELAHRLVDREPEPFGIVGKRVKDVRRPCGLQVGRIGEALRLGGWVQHLLGAPLGCMQEIELL